ncbi:MAG: cation:proton antiporter [Planctomycetota bacterium]
MPPAEVFWSLLLQILVLLAGALGLGALFGKLKQSPIVGYLLAGVLLGPGVLDWVPSSGDVSVVAELGVALLLFSIGLEFSLAKLIGLGWRVFVAGGVQVAATSLVFTTGLWVFGLPGPVALVLGMAAALSSTEVALAVMQSRGEVDSQHGRFGLGILLMQDLAVIPIVLIVTVVASTAAGANDAAAEHAAAAWRWVSGEAHAAGAVDTGETPKGAGAIAWKMAVSFFYVGAFAVGFYVFSRFLLPVLVRHTPLSRGGEMTILLAIVLAAGSAFLAHEMGMSPALGAFIAAIFLGESVIASKLESDIGPLRTVFATLFFSSVGMLAEPMWIVQHGGWVLLGVAAVVIGKPLVIWPIGRLMGLTHRHALAAGIVLAQLGVFSFVVVGIARQSGAGFLSDDVFNAMVAITIVTLFLTPYLCKGALPMGSWVQGRMRKLGLDRSDAGKGDKPASAPVSGHVVLIGFGPAGRAVYETLKASGVPIVVLDLNPVSVMEARADGAAAFVGDAARGDVLHHAHVHSAKAVVITLPDHRAAIHTIHAVRSECPTVMLIVRARYDRWADELKLAGAHRVINEERSVGTMLSFEATQLV